MKKVLIFASIVLLAIGIYWNFFKQKEITKPEPPPLAHIQLKKHSENFNRAIDNVVISYLSMKNAFVEADTVSIKKSTKDFIVLLNKLPLDEMKKGDSSNVYLTIKSTVDDLISNANSLLTQHDITEMRHDFSTVTDMLYPTFFTAVNYEGNKLFVAKCPMAFSDSIAANWISNSAEIVNPYLGKNHPKYHAGMLGCGEIVDSIVAK